MNWTPFSTHWQPLSLLKHGDDWEAFLIQAEPRSVDMIDGLVVSLEDMTPEMTTAASSADLASV